MTFDPIRIVVFLHILLFAYWLGADLGVFLCGLGARRKGVSAEAKALVQEVGGLIDMAPRTCLVLMVPVGLTLAQNYGLPISGLPLAIIWVAALAWLYLVWMVHLEHDAPIGRVLWNIDFALRTVVMAAFVGFGAWCLITGGPIAGYWLATKILLFGIIILLGIIVRILLLMTPHAPPETTAEEPKPNALFSTIRNVVFGIWGLVFMIAFLGVAKPF